MQRRTYLISSRWRRRSQKRRRSKVKRRRNPVKIRRSRDSRRRRRSSALRRRPWKTLVRRRRKLPVRSKKNICIIRFPKRGYRMNCPLMSWCFERWIRGGRIPFQVAKPHPSCKKSGPCLRVPFRARCRSKKSHAQPRRCPDFLRAALREMAKKEGAKRTLASVAKKRRHYSDNEIFYKLANSLSRMREEDNAEGRSEGVALTISQPTGGT